MTYLVLSLIFLAVAVLVLVIALVTRSSHRALVSRWWLPVVTAGVIVMILTAVFDNVMIRVGLMKYAQETVSGLVVGVAPLEDFAYPLAGLILLPSLWLLFGRRGVHER